MHNSKTGMFLASPVAELCNKHFEKLFISKQIYLLNHRRIVKAAVFKENRFMHTAHLIQQYFNQPANNVYRKNHAKGAT